MVHPKTGAPLAKKCTVHLREGCTFAEEHPESTAPERPIAGKPSFQRLCAECTFSFSWTFGAGWQDGLVELATRLWSVGSVGRTRCQPILPGYRPDLWIMRPYSYHGSAVPTEFPYRFFTSHSRQNQKIIRDGPYDHHPQIVP